MTHDQPHTASQPGPEHVETEVTRLLDRIRAGHNGSFSDLVSLLYGDLRVLARAQLRREAAGHTLQPTELVHELYVRLAAIDPNLWRNRREILSMSATAMRRILVDHARAKLRHKRQGKRVHVPLPSDVISPASGIDPLDWIALCEALETLEQDSPRRTQVAQLLGLAGLTAAEAAEILGTSKRTVEREWKEARDYLRRELGREVVGRVLLDAPDPGAGAATKRPVEELPKTIGRYEVLRKLGQGGMGDVYLALDAKLNRNVAVKVLKDGFQPESKERLHREGRLLAAMNHPNIAVVYSMEDEGPGSFLTLEFVDGETLHERISLGKLGGLSGVLRTAREIALALEAAHASGILHLDLKPANILFDPEGRVKVVDFGLGRNVNRSGDASANDRSTAGRPDDRSTAGHPTEGAAAERVAGTLGFMSPEQMAGRPLDDRADVWAFANVLVLLLTSSLDPEPEKEAAEKEAKEAAAAESLGLSSEFRESLRMSLHAEPEKRPSAAVWRRILEDEIVAATTYGRTRSEDSAEIHPSLEEPPTTGRAGDGRRRLRLRTPTSLWGRDEERDKLKRLLQDERLITLTGAGGIGKTALAATAALDWLEPDSIAYFIDLAAIREPAGVPSAFGDALGFTPAPRSPFHVALVRHLRSTSDAPRLLVVDNCEHLLDDVRDILSEVLEQTDAVVLCTSREPLRLPTEQVLRVGPLAIPKADGSINSLEATASSAMLLDRVREANPEFRLLPTDSSALASICRLLGGVPLGLELAAMRCRQLPINDVAQHLGSAGVSVVGERWATSEQHRSVEKAIGWSYELLSEDGRAFFLACAAFPSGWTADAIGIVVADDVPTWLHLNLLQGLVDKSVVEVEPRAGRALRTGATPRVVPRYRFLEPIREFARRKLEESGRASHYDLRLLDAIAGFVRTAAPHLKSKDQREWLDALETEREAIQRALAIAAADPSLHLKGLRLVRQLGMFWSLRGSWETALASYEEWLARVTEEKAVELPGGSGEGIDLLRADTCNWMGNLAFRLGSFDKAAHAYEAVLPTARQHGDAALEGRALVNLGAVELIRGKLTEARTVLWQALRVQRKRRDHAEIAVILLNLGVASERESDLRNARRFYAASLRLRRRIGEPNSIALSLNNLGIIEEKAGHLDEARSHHEEAVEIRRSIGDRGGLAQSLFSLAAVQALTGETRIAKQVLLDCLELRIELGDPHAVADTLDSLGVLLADEVGDGTTPLPQPTVLCTALARRLRVELEDVVTSPTLKHRVTEARSRVRERISPKEWEAAEDAAWANTPQQVLRTLKELTDAQADPG